MSKIEMTYDLAMAASRDAGNRSMREGGRTAWAVKDWNVACETFERLWPETKGKGEGGKRRLSEHGDTNM